MDVIRQRMLQVVQRAIVQMQETPTRTWPLLTLESEARWHLGRTPVANAQIPNDARFLAPGPSRAVAPESVLLRD
ncbi:hypothetical protein [Rhabdochromatium marinum]|uniref:hypothetical protein n=1 Tax=Rhabdochromatium marinum TaxID=48729 RepID=UPI0019054E82|nr:hypothetical protein [Rhabdochromatium marinum]